MDENEWRTCTDPAAMLDFVLDAGCDSDEVLDHLCGPRLHARGCWVVDLLLSRE